MTQDLILLTDASTAKVGYLFTERNKPLLSPWLYLISLCFFSPLFEQQKNINFFIVF